MKPTNKELNNNDQFTEFTKLYKESLILNHKINNIQETPDTIEKIINNLELYKKFNFFQIENGKYKNITTFQEPSNKIHNKIDDTNIVENKKISNIDNNCDTDISDIYDLFI